MSVCTYPAGHHYLNQTSSGAEDSNSLLMSETHQRLTINHQQLITGMETTVPETRTDLDRNNSPPLQTSELSHIVSDLELAFREDIPPPKLHVSSF